MLNMQRSDEIHVAATADLAELWLVPKLESFKAEHPHILFCVNGEGDAPLRVGPVDCEIGFGPNRDDATEDVLFRDFVLPISSPENTRRIARKRLQDRLEGFPLLHLDFYKEDPQVPNWTAWIEANRLRRTAPDRGIRFQRIRPTLDAVLASAGLAICGLALLGGRIDDATLSLPFPLSTGGWTGHAFRARFRPAALSRPQVKAFREWLISQAADTRTWLAHVAESVGASDKGRRVAKKGRQRIPKAQA